MNDQVLALQIAAAIFLLVCISHVLRLILRVKVTIGNFVVPLWLSFAGALVSALLALWIIGIIK